MKPEIKKFQLSDEYYFQEGCHIVEISNTDADEQLSIARARVEPHCTTVWHKLINTIERYVILEGSGEVEIGDLPAVSVKPGDAVIIPEQTRQRIHNSGNNDLIFLAICSPRFIPENYVALEQN